MAVSFLQNPAHTFMIKTEPFMSSVGRDCIFVCDFDGTISLKDVTDVLLQRFSQSGYEELEEAWEVGEIGSQACMEGQVALIDASQAELDGCLAEIKIDKAFKEFVTTMQKLKLPIHIVSDGLDYAISKILENNGLTDLPIFANRLVHVGERGWRLDFPYANAACSKRSGNCKCAHVTMLKKQYGSILYVGDGASDYCVAHQVDLVLAKDKLITYCQKETINHHPIQNFFDVLAWLSEL